MRLMRDASDAFYCSWSIWSVESYASAPCVSRMPSGGCLEGLAWNFWMEGISDSVRLQDVHRVTVLSQSWSYILETCPSCHWHLCTLRCTLWRKGRELLPPSPSPDWIEYSRWNRRHLQLVPKLSSPVLSSMRTGRLACHVELRRVLWPLERYFQSWGPHQSHGSHHWGPHHSPFRRQRSRNVKNDIFERNLFSMITSVLEMIEQSLWHQRVCLVKTHRNMYSMTLKCHGQNFTSGQGHMVTQVGHIAYDSMRLYERNTMRPLTRLYLFWIKS